MRKYQGVGPINRIGLYPVPDWRDYILVIWDKYRKRNHDLEFTGLGEWWIWISDQGVRELREIARELGYKRNYSGVEAMLSAADRLDVGYAIRPTEKDPRPRLRELAGLQ